MTLRLVTSNDDVSPSSSAISLSDRFWSLAGPEPEPDLDSPLLIAERLLSVLARFRRLEHGNGNESTISVLSLSTLLHQQEAVGDVKYASPEQLRGEHMTERSLVFTIGVLLFERLCARHPFGVDDNPVRLVRMSRAEFGSSVNLLPKLPPALRAILTVALSPLPEERYHTVDELASALTVFVREERKAPVLPGAPPVVQVTFSSGPRRPVRTRPISEFDRLPTGEDDGQIGARAFDPEELEHLGVSDDEPTQVRAVRRAPSTDPFAQDTDQPAIADRSEPRFPAGTTPPPVPLAETTVVREAVPAPVPLMPTVKISEDERRPLPTAASRPAAASRARTTRHLPTAVWFALGVAAATVAFAVWSASRSSDVAAPSSAGAIDSTARLGQPAADDDSEPVAEKMAEQAEPTPLPAVAEPIVSQLPVTHFDPDHIADRALAAAETCFERRFDDGAEPLAFGFGLLFEPYDPVAAKAYFPVDAELHWRDQECVKAAILKVVAGAAPERITAIEMRATLWATGSDIAVKRVLH